MARSAGFLAGAALAIGASGCASHRPAPLLVERQAVPARTSCADKGFHLKMVTYNIWGLPSWMTGARSDRYPHIASELERLDPDFILLQEAWTAKARKAAPASGRWAIARAAGQHTFFQQSGLVTLSKCPIIGGEFYPFSRAAYLDRFVNKGVLKVTVLLPGGQVLNVWNAHLQQGRWTEVQQSQARQLVEWVQAAEDGQIADLIGGDFNCTPESPLAQELARSLGPSVQQLNGSEPFVTWDGRGAKPGKAKTIDYVFIRERAIFQDLQVVPRVVFAAANPQQRLSDHLGLEAMLTLNPALNLAKAVGPPPDSSLSPALAIGRAGRSELWLVRENSAPIGAESSTQMREGAGD